jgi:hypothetical protein
MFNDATIVKRGNTVIVQHGDDSGLFVRFYSDAIQNHEKTNQEGRPIYDQVEMCEILFAGDSTKTKIGRATEGNPPYYLRFPRQYEAFKQQQEVVQDGTPIEHWPPISKAQALELKAMNIHTVEMLASVPDVNLKWMGARQLRENAKVWLSEAEAGKEAIRLNNKIEELQMQIEAMKNQNSGFSASQKQEEVVQSQSIAPPSLEAPDIKPIVTKMRGRPKKVENGANITPTDATSSE